MSEFDGERLDGAKYVPSVTSDGTQEGYPGIAHDFEQMRQQLAAKEKDRQYHMDAINRLASFLALSGTSFEVVQAAMDNMRRLSEESAAAVTLRRDLRIERERVRELEHPTGSVIRCDKCGTEETVKFQYAPESQRIEELKQQVRELTNSCDEWGKNYRSVSDGRDFFKKAYERAEAALAEAQQTSTTQASLRMPKDFKWPEHKPVWVGGANMDALPKNLEKLAGNEPIKEQSSAEPVAWRHRAWNGLYGKWGDWCHTSSEPQGKNGLLFTKEPLYVAPPPIAAAVALAVEKCAKIARNNISGVAHGKAVEQAIRALAPTLTAEAEKMREDADMYRHLRAFGLTENLHGMYVEHLDAAVKATIDAERKA